MPNAVFSMLFLRRCAAWDYYYRGYLEFTYRGIDQSEVEIVTNLDQCEGEIVTN